MNKYHDHSWHTNCEHGSIDDDNYTCDELDGCTGCGEDTCGNSFVCEFCEHEFGIDCRCCRAGAGQDLRKRRVMDYTTRFVMARNEIKAVVLESTPLIPPLVDIIIEFATVRRVPGHYTLEEGADACAWCVEQPTHLQPPRAWPVNEETLFRYYTRKHKISADSILQEYQRDRRVREAWGTTKRTRVVFP